jgi:hypothetical protein
MRRIKVVHGKIEVVTIDMDDDTESIDRFSLKEVKQILKAQKEADKKKGEVENKG